MADSIQWEPICDEAREVFRDLLRFDTTNPPGNEKEAAKYLEKVLKKDGLKVESFDSAPNRTNLVTRVKGDGSGRPVLLHGHLDVVAVEPDKWSVDPFAAEIKDGFIYGRGAVDMKNFVAQAAMAVKLLKRNGVSLKRDVIFCAVADEENGMRFGSKWMAENHRNRIDAEYAIGEGGGFQMHVRDSSVFTVMIAEKGVCWLRVKATGTPGHGAVPHGDMAAVKLAGAVAKLGAKRLPLHVTPAGRAMVEALADRQPLPLGLVLKQVLRPAVSDLILDRAVSDKQQASALAALLHNTVSPNVIRAGEKTNVIPGEAVFELDGRILPGFTKEEFLDEVKAVIGDGFEIEVLNYGEPTQAPFDDPLVDTIRGVLNEVMPGAELVPFLLPGYTDAKNFSSEGTKAYGFAPLLLPKDLSYNTLAHGHDERISVEAFDFGVKTLYRVIEAFCA